SKRRGGFKKLQAVRPSLYFKREVGRACVLAVEVGLAGQYHQLQIFQGTAPVLWRLDSDIVRQLAIGCYRNTPIVTAESVVPGVAGQLCRGFAIPRKPKETVGQILEQGGEEHLLAIQQAVTNQVKRHALSPGLAFPANCHAIIDVNVEV